MFTAASCTKANRWKRPRGPSGDDGYTRGPSIQGTVPQPGRGMKNGREGPREAGRPSDVEEPWKKPCCVTGARHHSPRDAGVHFYKISPTGRSLRRQQMREGQGLGGGGVGREGAMGRRHCGVTQYFRTRQKWWLHNTVTVLYATELFTLKWLIFCHVNFTSIN